MANVIINDKHLTDIGNSLRKHLGETKEVKVDEIITPLERQITKTKNAIDWDNFSGSHETSSFYTTITMPGAKQIKVDMAYGSAGTSYSYVQVWAGDSRTPTGTKYGGSKTRVQLIFDGDTVTFYWKASTSYPNYFGYYAEVIPLDNNGQEITEVITPVYETVKNDFLPVEMGPAIDSIDPKNTVNNWIADTEHYGITTWSNAGSSNLQNLTLPDGVEFEDIVYLSGLATNSSNSSSTTNGMFPYVYCPMLWNHTIPADSAVTWARDKTLYFCGGFGSSVSSSTHAPGPVYGITEDNVFLDVLYYSSKYYMMLSPSKDGTSITFTYSFKDISSQTRAYALTKYAKAIMIYKKKSEV